jgi:hypothetical protein
MELRRCGGPKWSHPAFWGVVNLPDFLEPFTGAVSVVRQWRENAMARAAGRKVG